MNLKLVFRINAVISVINGFGLLFATLLTLIVTPALLMLRENISLWYQKKISS